MNTSIRSSIWILALMGLTAYALMHYVDTTLVDEPGIRMTLPKMAGGKVGHELRYCHAKDCKKQFFSDELGQDQNLCPACGAPLFNMSLEEWDALPKDTTFIKARYGEETNNPVFVSIVLTGKDRESIHRPERCLVGQGMKITRSLVIPAPLSNGKTLQLTVLEFQREVRTEKGVSYVYGYYAYWFVGVGRETHSHWARMFWLAWDRIVNSVAHKWAYISISGSRDPTSSVYQDEIRGYIGDLHDDLVL